MNDLGPSLTKLLSIASGPIGTSLRPDAKPRIEGSPGLVRELEALYASRNGFYAFESALHFFASGEAEGEPSLEIWNQPETWIERYAGLASGCFFFAEDVFGDQFCIREDGVRRFEAETGKCVSIAPTVEAWAERILRDYDVETGYPLAQAWQQTHGPLPRGRRLLPTRLFTLGGDYRVENLGAVNAIEGMRYRGSIATQLMDVPEGAEVEIQIIERPPVAQ